MAEITVFFLLLVTLFYAAAYVSPKLKFRKQEDDPKGWQDIVLGILKLFAILTIALLVTIVVLKHKGGVYAYKAAIFAYIVMAVYRIGTAIGDTVSPAKKTAALALACTIAGSCILYPNSFTLDIAAFVIAIWLLAFLANLRFLRIAMLGAAVVLYDAFHVFGTHLMQTAAGEITGVRLPTMITLPLFQIGLGDIVLPGMLVVFGIRKAKELGVPILGMSGIAGYAVGLFVTLFALYKSHYPQPATIYLIPAVMLALLGTAYMTGNYSKFVRSEYKNST